MTLAISSLVSCAFMQCKCTWIISNISRLALYKIDYRLIDNDVISDLNHLITSKFKCRFGGDYERYDYWAINLTRQHCQGPRPMAAHDHRGTWREPVNVFNELRRPRQAWQSLKIEPLHLGFQMMAAQFMSAFMFRTSDLTNGRCHVWFFKSPDGGKRPIHNVSQALLAGCHLANSLPLRFVFFSFRLWFVADACSDFACCW